MHKRALIPLGLLLLVVIGGWWLVGHPEHAPDWLARRLHREDILATAAVAGSGNIEAETTTVGSEAGGRIVDLAADEGDYVRTGQVLARIDTALLEAQLRQAEAALAVAQARLAQVRAGPSDGEIHQARVAVAQAEAARDAARQALADATLARDNPQQLDARIVAARSDLALAEAQALQAAAARDAAQAQRDQAQHTYDIFGGTITLPTGEKITEDMVWTQVEVATGRWWGTWEGLLLAQAARDGAKEVLAALLALRRQPLAADAQVHAAEARLAQAQAEVAASEAALADLEAGPLAEQISVAEAQVRQAEAAADTLRTQLAKMTLTAPRDGIVTHRARNVGEMAAPGAALLTLADLDQVRLVIYVPEDQIGRVHLGQPFDVSVDGFPGRVFGGRVIYISPQAEFTPKNVQTQDARVNQVFAVKLALDNPEHALKPGMPADAAARTE